MKTRKEQQVSAASHAPERHYNWATKAPPGQQQITAFRGFGNGQRIHLQGRVRAVGRESLAGVGGAADNSGARSVTLHIGGQSFSTGLTRLGYYCATVTLDTALSNHARWENVLVVADTGHGTLTARHRIYLPNAQPALLVIVDLDGTLLPTRHASEGLPLVACSGFTGLSSALSGAQSDDQARPLFCISSHGWDRYQSCCQMLADAGLPESPVLLHPAPSPGTSMDHDASKGHHLAQILNTYPASPAVFLTSPSNLAQAALRKTVAAHSKQFRAIYAIGGQAGQQPQRVAELSGLCPNLHVVDNPAAAVGHAHRLGLIENAQLSDLMQRPPQR